MQGEFDEASQMENIPVGTYQGRVIYLKDVARVDDSLEERTQQTYIGGREVP